MRSAQITISLLLILLVCTTPLLAQESTEEPVAEATEIVEVGETTATGTYTVQAGDNLYRIAIQYGLTIEQLAAANGITNPALIYTGQQLTIPGGGTVTVIDSQPPATPQPEATNEVIPETDQQETVGTGTYTVQAGENLYRIALKNNTSVAELMRLNNITNQNLVFSGQILVIPGGDNTTSDNTTTDTVLNTPPVENVDFAYGIEVFEGDPNVTLAVQQVNQLGVSWVKVRANWRELEPTEGQINFAGLDNTINALKTANVKIMLTVTTAPQWARTSTEEDGPPDDIAKFTTFVEALANHYNGEVDAYQIWNEPNLRRNWNCVQRMCNTDYLEMLKQAYTTIKNVDSNVIVLTAGLAPTRFNDRVNAIDDRLFFETLYAKGVAAFSDALAIHPGGFANPPDATCCEQSNDVLTHYEDASFFFKDNLEIYRSIMAEYGDEDTALWVTKFGWGSSEDTESPSEINVYVSYTSLTEQAMYTPRAFEIGDELGYVGPMFLDNLNGCQSKLALVELCYTALISPNNQPRPVFSAVANAEKPMPEATETSGN